MFLLSKFFPKLLKPEKHRGYDSDAAYGGEKPKDYRCKIVLLDDTELNLASKVSCNVAFIHDHVNLDLYNSLDEIFLPLTDMNW